MFTKILIANRGEIACRVMRTCQRLGISTVAVFSEADADAQHVRMADEAYCLGPAPSRESYLRIESVMDAASRSGAAAIHPGYGFLSENEAFARACNEAGIVFIGPPVEAIRAMGSKSAAKALMAKAGVPLVPGYHGDRQEPDFLEQQAEQIGFPVLIKASAGGGGKGMRVVEDAGAFKSCLASCRREASAAFGDDRVLIEKYLQRPRHIEVQIFGDAHGSVISLHERDCSAQRRHQKVVEEAPAPGMTSARRAAMATAACAAARAVRYVGAGTVEFIVPERGEDFYFMEMNTRLQVEHPVTEMVTGQDLVEWQIRVAAGQSLPLSQEEVPLRGHAIEVRVYAEEPAKGFLPSIGRLRHFRTPQTSDTVRVDSGVVQGDVVSAHYDPMLAKLIVWGEQRDQAILRMRRALQTFQIVGVGNNLEFLDRLVGSAAFRQGRVDTGLIEREQERLTNRPGSTPIEAVILAAFFTVREEGRLVPDSSVDGADARSPWSLADGWRLNGRLERTLRLMAEDERHDVRLEYSGGGVFKLNDRTCTGAATGSGELRLQWGEAHLVGTVVSDGETLFVFFQGRRYAVRVDDPLLHAGADLEEHGGFAAPMSGKIIAIQTALGAEAEKGDCLLVMEAMKMEHSLCAPSRGIVREYFCAVGDQVEEGMELLSFEPVD